MESDTHFDPLAADASEPAAPQTVPEKVMAFLGKLYQRTVLPKLDPRTREVMEVLAKMPLFEPLSRRDLRLLAEAMHTRQYKRNEFIYRERDPSLGMYIIEKGRVRLLTEDEDEQPHELRQVGERGTFGELAVLGDFRRQETAQATIETHLLGFFQPELRTMINRDPGTAAAILACLARRIATQYVVLSKVLSEKEGKLIARRLQDVAVLRGELKQRTSAASAGR